MDQQIKEWNETDKAKLAKMAARGDSSRAIAEALDTSRAAIIGAARRNGVALRYSALGNHNVPWTAEEKRCLVDLGRRGYTAKEIAQQLGRGEQAVRHMAYKLGATTGGGRRGRAGNLGGGRSNGRAPTGHLPTGRKHRIETLAKDAPSVSLLERRPWQCPFPLWLDEERPPSPPLCCGRQREIGSRYCPGHREVCTRDGNLEADWG